MDSRKWEDLVILLDKVVFGILMLQNANTKLNMELESGDCSMLRFWEVYNMPSTCSGFSLY